MTKVFMSKHGMIRLMPDEHDLAQWKLAWDLQDLPSPHVLCRVCGAIQIVQERHIAFEHESDCAAFYAYEQLPWRDLMWILENISSSESG
jgi:hypothetical protein